LLPLEFQFSNLVGALKSMLKKIFNFYYEGFKKMTWGRKLWGIILVKLFIMFAILRLFFFPDLLKRDFDSDEERASHVLEQLTNP
jgi:hypothetical protein